ncbi:MAG: hypothetical protein JO284_00015 [Planctomycetaceae bacterium]|nr:hypothetical protein [Planctomycetaceae bacterium]MBV8231024.1 hypothetical protein [Planctomycetaceae bacterium]MBV8264881.1 hypothetical protein [Planctomycetaceae bacterium]MBV8316995.1 hypothetical protein [Planctomycetaceae bacterium]MBV8384009.1 hypothetical protein [Planctomycetaceae bacterium]
MRGSDFDSNGASIQDGWPTWLENFARGIARANPGDPRVAFVVDLIQSSADEARFNGLTDVLVHRRWLMETGSDEPAAPIPPWTEADGEPLPW